IHHRFFSGCRFSRESTGGGGEPGLEPLTVRCVDSLSSEGVSQKGSRPLKALSVATLPALLAPPHSGHFYLMFESRIRNKYNRSSGTSMWTPPRLDLCRSILIGFQSHAPVMRVKAGWASSRA